MRRTRLTVVPLAVVALVVLGVAFPGAAFADETPPPDGGGGVPTDPGGTGPTDVTDLPALPSGGQPSIDPQVPEGESEPPGPLPGPAVYDTSTAPNAPGPYPLVVPPEAMAALRAQLAARYGSVEAGASAEGVDLATREVSGSTDVTAADAARVRAAEIFRLAQSLHRMVPKAWSSWTGNATTLWIL